MKSGLIGIYCILNIINDKKYIGFSKNIDYRIKRHKHYLESNIHKNKYLQSSYNKYGKENFEFFIIELCDEDQLNKKEIEYIEKYKSISPFGYNSTSGGEGLLCPCEELRKRMSDNISGTKHMFYNKEFSEEHKSKLSKSLLGNKRGSLSQGIKKSNRKYVGVFWNKKRNKWQSSITFDCKPFYIGIFKTDVEAAMAYNEVALDVHGWKANINKVSEIDILKAWDI